MQAGLRRNDDKGRNDLADEGRRVYAFAIILSNNTITHAYHKNR